MVATVGAVLLALLAVTPPVLAAGGWGPTERVVPLQRQVYGVDSVIDRAGTTTAVWSRKDGDARQIMAARRPAAGEWSTPLVVENVGRVAGEPRVAADGHGRLTVVWSTMRSVQAVQRLPWGRWTDPVTIGTAPRGYAPAYLGLASNADGLTLATWELMDDDQDSTYAPSRVVAVLRQPTGSWGRPTVLTPRSQRSYRPQPAVTADGEAMLVWDSETRASGTVMFSSRWPGAGWSMARPLSPPSTHAAAPQLAVNAHGAVVVAWVAVGRFDRVQAVRRPSDGRWSPPVSLSTTAGDVWWHDVASAANGASTVGWALRDGSVHAADWKPGPGWGRPVTVAPRGSVFYELELLRNGRGDTLATWTSVSGGDHPVVTAYRPMGGAWQAPARVSQPSGDAFGAAALGPFGRAGVVWVNGNVGLTGPVYARFHQPG
jgi:hypothetical protein